MDNHQDQQHGFMAARADVCSLIHPCVLNGVVGSTDVLHL